MKIRDRGVRAHELAVRAVKHIRKIHAHQFVRTLAHTNSEPADFHGSIVYIIFVIY